MPNVKSSPEDYIGYTDKNDYAEKLEQQIAQYVDYGDMQQLPPSYFHWGIGSFFPGFYDVYGPVDIHEFFAKPFMEGADNQQRPRFLSIGCGDGTVEIGVAQKLIDSGLADSEFVCADLSPVLLERFEANLKPEMRSLFILRAVDLNQMDSGIAGEFNGVMASHSLHHLVELDRIFRWVKRVLKPGGTFAINDMIGRNGHMRWPETGQFVQMLWPLLNDRQRYNVLLKRLYDVFEDHDCSTFGFEGIRAQDILPLLLINFYPKRFFATGGLIDPFIDRGFGFGFDVSNEKDKTLLDFISKLNDVLLDAGQIKPTLMLAYFVKEPCEEKFFRMRSAKACVREPTTDLGWTAAYPQIVVGP